MFNNANLHLLDSKITQEFKDNAKMKIMDEYTDQENVNFKRAMKAVDTPYLERFFLAEKVCNENNNHSHLKVFNTIY